MRITAYLTLVTLAVSAVPNAPALAGDVSATSEAWEKVAMVLKLHPSLPRNYSAAEPVGGYGSCGQFCNDIDLGNFDCGEDERPVWDDDGNCSCEEFSECQ